ncbi:MAG TPA: CHAP domain-containing protein [Candidatus Limnocylindrales bacterium]
MKRVKVLRSLVAAVMALGLVATLPGIAAASSRVGGSPAGGSARTSAGSTIASVANRYVGYGACGLGGSGFVSPSGSYSCAAGNPIAGWCDEFAGFVWAKSGVVKTSGLGTGPGGFVTYAGGDPLSQTPHVGDVAVMSPPNTSTNSHVAIVTAVSGTSVTMVGGNEGGGQGVVARSYYTAGNYQRTPTDGYHYHVRGYVAPKLK